MAEGYKTLRGRGVIEITEKRSRFIGVAAPAATEAEALAFVEEIRAANRQATHNVFAYSLRENNLLRYSDDGEPQGTAGLPVLDVLSRGGITDAAIVVTRYFGGTLLGTGGLVRVYGASALQAVQAAGVAQMERCAVYDVTCAYADYDRLTRLLAALDATVEESAFEDVVRLGVALMEPDGEKLVAQVVELTRGQQTPALRCVKYVDVAQR